MGWEIFQQAAASYEQWYETRRGRHAEAAERELLKWLLSPFRGARTVLEVGSGAGHFTGWLAKSGFTVLGLDRAPAMVEEASRRFPSIPFVLGDAHQLPFRVGAFDVVVFVTTIEFLDHPLAALREAVQVARRGVAAIVLNRYSFGGISRRWGRQSRRPLLGSAQDYSLSALRRAMQVACGPRMSTVAWSSSLFPDGLWSVRARVPAGDVLGVSMQLRA